MLFWGLVRSLFWGLTTVVTLSPSVQCVQYFIQGDTSRNLSKFDKHVHVPQRVNSVNLGDVVSLASSTTTPGKWLAHNELHSQTVHTHKSVLKPFIQVFQAIQVSSMSHSLRKLYSQNLNVNSIS